MNSNPGHRRNSSVAVSSLARILLHMSTNSNSKDTRHLGCNLDLAKCKLCDSNA